MKRIPASMSLPYGIDHPSFYVVENCTFGHVCSEKNKEKHYRIVYHSIVLSVIMATITSEAVEISDNYSIFTEDTFSTVMARRDKKREERDERNAKWLEDQNMFKTRRRHPITGEMERIILYNTGFTPGSRIRHAVSGGRYDDVLLGSLRENLLFKVQVSLQKTPVSLYFSSPEEYERTFYATLPKETKHEWNLKRENYIQLAKKMNEQDGLPLGH